MEANGSFGLYGEFIRDIDDRDCDPITRSQCPRAKHFKNTQHIYRPESDYQTDLEKRFRNLGENTIEMCAFKHCIDDTTLPEPEKPSEEYMRWRIEQSRVHPSVRLKEMLDE